jgi:hypothetical protein
MSFLSRFPDAKRGEKQSYFRRYIFFKHGWCVCLSPSLIPEVSETCSPVDGVFPEKPPQRTLQKRKS